MKQLLALLLILSSAIAFSAAGADVYESRTNEKNTAELPFFGGKQVSSLKGMLVRTVLKNDLLDEVPDSYFASQGALTKLFFDYTGIDNLNDVLPDIAKEYFFYTKGKLSAIPAWLKPHLDLSIQELIDNDMLPKIGSNNILSLSNKHISDLTGLQNIPDIGNIRALGLSNNKLTTLTPGIFAGLNNLANLDLTRNNLTTVAPGTFAGLNNLRNLYFDFSNLTTIEPGTFAGLNNLRNLYLNFNKLTTIAPGTFAGLNNLNTLSLSNNNLTTVAPGAFAGLERLRHLTLNNNNIPGEDRARIQAEVGNNVRIQW